MKLSPRYSELSRYLVVGGCSVAIDMLSYYLLQGPAGVSPSWAKRISFTLGAVWAFFANKIFTFRKPGLKLSEPFLFILVYLVGFFSNSLVHDYILLITGEKIIALVVATITSVVLNFVGQKWIVFRNRPE